MNTFKNINNIWYAHFIRTVPIIHDTLGIGIHITDVKNIVITLLKHYVVEFLYLEIEIIN